MPILDANGMEIPSTKFKAVTEPLLKWLDEQELKYNVMYDDEGSFVTFPWCTLAVLYSEQVPEGKCALVEPPNEEGKLIAHIYELKEAEDFLLEVWSYVQNPPPVEEKEEKENDD